MRQTRKEDLSIYYWLVGLMPTWVNVVDGFPLEDFEPPTVSIEMMPTKGMPYELGGAEQLHQFWRIDVFGKNKTQRDEYAGLIFDELENNIPVYDYDEGFPPTVSPTQLGVLKCWDRQDVPVYTFKELVRELYWRRSITFWTYFETI